MFHVGLVENKMYVESLDREGISLTLDHRDSLCFDTEYAAWQFLLLLADCLVYEIEDFFVEFFDFEEEN